MRLGVCQTVDDPELQDVHTLAVVPAADGQRVVRQPGRSPGEVVEWDDERFQRDRLLAAQFFVDRRFGQAEQVPDLLPQPVGIADDSGIEVDALSGGPGMYSARYGGAGLDDEGQLSRLLHEMAQVPDGERGARYRAVVAIAWPVTGDAVESAVFEGVQEGSLARRRVGTEGFGYDPIFVVARGRTQAQLSAAEKDAISHRAQAVRKALAFLKARCQ